MNTSQINLKMIVLNANKGKYVMKFQIKTTTDRGYVFSFEKTIF